MNILKRIFRRKQRPVVNTQDGRCVMLLPNLLHHATLRAKGEITEDFQTWARKTYGDVKFI